uniref:Uncharacterized protein n=1 Tax=Meloidogyne enterolobii TaxID=390850 RepID=A0A6V7Y8E3_MELEN|nr:unnamed protein product [Meloidogyne enterolobii]
MPVRSLNKLGPFSKHSFKEGEFPDFAAPLKTSLIFVCSLSSLNTAKCGK